MAKKLTEAPVMSDDIDTSLLTETPEGWEFETLVDETPTRVIFDEIGDVFIGQFEELRTITPDNGKDESFELLIFRGRDDQPYAVNNSYKMQEAVSLLKSGDWVRLTYTKDIESNKGNPMKDIKVDIRKN